MNTKKRFFGYLEVVFDCLYLVTGLFIGLLLLHQRKSSAQTVAGVMAVLLIIGDSFHLVPRVLSIIKCNTQRYRRALGIGKLITSITMTIFYCLLWQIGLLLFSPPNATIPSALVYIFAGIRIFLCLLPQNRWTEEKPPVFWGIVRNIPFLLQGAIVIVLFWNYRMIQPSLENLWLALALSFLFYIPVVLWAEKIPKIGMLMLPKSIMYLWILVLFLKI